MIEIICVTPLGGRERNFHVHVILLSKLVRPARLSGLTREASNLFVEGSSLVGSIKK